MKSLFQISGIKDRLTWHHIKQQSGMKRSKFSTSHSLPAVAGNKGRAIQTPHKRAKHTSGDRSSDPNASQTVWRGGGGGATSSLNSFPLPPSLAFTELIYGTNGLSQKPQEPEKIMKRGRRYRGRARMPTSGRRPV